MWFTSTFNKKELIFLRISTRSWWVSCVQKTVSPKSWSIPMQHFWFAGAYYLAKFIGDECSIYEFLRSVSVVFFFYCLLSSIIDSHVWRDCYTWTTKEKSKRNIRQVCLCRQTSHVKCKSLLVVYATCKWSPMFKVTRCMCKHFELSSHSSICHARLPNPSPGSFISGSYSMTKHGIDPYGEGKWSVIFSSI